MDFFTAGIALIVTQLCVALVMIGIYLLAPHEPYARIWGLSEALLAFGVLLIVLNAGALRYPVLTLGHSALIAGTILQWRGNQDFFGERAGRAGWVIGAAFLILHLLVLASTEKIAPRAVVLSTTLLVLLAFNFLTLWRGTANERSFGAWLTLGASFVLIANNLLRVASLLVLGNETRPFGPSTAVVMVTYMVPLGGILLYGTGLLLLYFERIVKEKHHLATHDELTGLLNRRAIVAGGEREIAVALRNGQPLLVAILDIDFFKRINDTHGHQAGDAVLRDVARLLAETCRSIDLVGRYGGEEFCLVLPGVGPEHARAIGLRLMAATAGYRYCGQQSLTVSIGFAALDAADGDQSWQTLLRRADEALYRAKELGRNRLCIAGNGAGDIALTATNAPAEAPAQYAEETASLAGVAEIR